MLPLGLSNPCKNSDGLGETVHFRSLARTFALYIYTKLKATDGNKHSYGTYAQNLHILESDLHNNNIPEPDRVQSSPDYKRAFSYPFQGSSFINGRTEHPCVISRNSEYTDYREMDTRDSGFEHRPVNGLCKQLTAMGNSRIPRSQSRSEHKHRRLKQSRSLDQSGRVYGIEENLTCKSGKRRASELPGSKYRREGVCNKYLENIDSLYTDNKEPTNMALVNEYDFQNVRKTNLPGDQENNYFRDKTSVSGSLNSSKDSNSHFPQTGKKKSSLKQYSSGCEDSKGSSLDSSMNLKKHGRQLDRHSSASPETSSNELPASKRRKSRSKRREIQKTKPTFYELSGLDLANPTGAPLSYGKERGNRRKPKTQCSVISSFSVLEAGTRDNNLERDAPLLRRKNCCVLYLLSAVCMVLLGVVTSLLILFLSAGDSSDGTAFDMVRAHIRLRILNRNYTDSMANHSHVTFTSFSEPFCTETDYVFLTSALYSEYFGCIIKQIRSGSIRLYYTAQFLNSDQVRNVSEIKAILSGTKGNGTRKRGVKDNTVYLGDFLVDVDSISVVLEEYKSQHLPERPRLVMKGFESTSVSSNPQNLHDRSSSMTSVSAMKTYTTITSLSNKETGVPNPSLLPDTTKTDFSAVETQLSVTTLQPTFKVSVLKTETWLPASTTDFAFEIDYTTTTETVVLPSIQMTNAEVYLNDKPAKLKCVVRGLKVYSGQISVYHKQTAETKTKVLLTLVNNGYVYSPIFQDSDENLSITHRTEEYVVTIVLNFKEVRCTDIGLYTCELKSQGNEYAKTGFLKGFGIPGQPKLRAPTSLLEDEELPKPITCTAYVGFPPGDLRFEIKPRGHTRFFPLQDGNTVTSGTCGTNKTISLMYTPTKDANGTLLKCIVDNEHVPNIQELSSVLELKIIPANICQGHTARKTLRHPFERSKYIVCHEKYFEVKECDNGVYYDQESERCGQTSLNMEDVVAYLNEGVASLKCRLTHTGTWTQITITKVDVSDDKRKRIVTVVRGHKPVIHNTTMKDRVFANVEIETQYEMQLTVWVYVLACEDQGDYFCKADAPFTIPEAKAHIYIRVKPSAPSLSVPNEIIEWLPTRYNFTCEADVGYPHGELILTVKLQNDSDFRVLPFQDEMIEDENNCSKVVRRTFKLVPAMVHNGMTIQCEVRNPATLPEGHSMVTSQTIHVVPGNFCLIKGDSTPHVHPYDCHQYVQCSENYIYVQRCGSDFCFDPDTLRCDRPDLQNKPTFDPNYPCRPNQNGVFYHHPFLCNKYIWCVQGEEIVQHCPVGTLYIDSGHCTFDADQSRCYKTKEPDIVS